MHDEKHVLKIEIDYGTQSTASFKDTTIEYKLKEVTKFRNEIDAVNYMSSNGWVFQNFTYVISHGNTGIDYRIHLFKREFDKSEFY